MFQIPVDSTAAIAQASTVGTLSAMIAYGIQWAKKSKYFPWLSDHTALANHYAAIILSLLASWGVHYKFDSEAHALTITGLCALCILHGAWDWAKQYIVTRVIYDAVVSKAPTVLVTPIDQPANVKGV